MATAMETSVPANLRKSGQSGKMCAVYVRRRFGTYSRPSGARRISRGGTHAKATDKPSVHRGVVLTPGALNAHFGIVQEMNDGETR